MSTVSLALSKNPFGASACTSCQVASPTGVDSLRAFDDGRSLHLALKALDPEFKSDEELLLALSAMSTVVQRSQCRSHQSRSSKWHQTRRAAGSVVGAGPLNELDPTYKENLWAGAPPSCDQQRRDTYHRSKRLKVSSAPSPMRAHRVASARKG